VPNVLRGGISLPWVICGGDVSSHPPPAHKLLPSGFWHFSLAGTFICCEIYFNKTTNSKRLQIEITFKIFTPAGTIFMIVIPLAISQINPQE
jgi:hypothetical protein